MLIENIRRGRLRNQHHQRESQSQMRYFVKLRWHTLQYFQNYRFPYLRKQLYADQIKEGEYQRWKALEYQEQWWMYMIVKIPHLNLHIGTHICQWVGIVFIYFELAAKFLRVAKWLNPYPSFHWL